MKVHTARTSALLDEIANGGREDQVGVDELLQHFSRRAFGMMLLIAIVPALLPVPVGVGAVSGALVILLGLQLLLLRSWPWLPGYLRRRGITRQRFRHTVKRLRPLLERFERISRPRLEVLAELPLANAFTGLLLILLGLLMALPIPLTNYPFGLLLLAFALAMIERDGVLLLIVWIVGAGACIAAVLLSKEVVELLARIFG